MIKRMVALSLVLLLSIESFAAVVSDNDGSAFITKAEFDSLKNNFQSQIDQYNTSIDSKIDGAIASYLSGIRIEKHIDFDNLISNIDQIYFLDTFLINWAHRTWTESGSTWVKTDGERVWGCPPDEPFQVINYNQTWMNVLSAFKISADEYFSSVFGAFIKWNQDKSSPFTANCNSSGIAAAGAPHFVLFKPDINGVYFANNIYREGALTNTLSWPIVRETSSTAASSKARTLADTVELSADSTYHSLKLGWAGQEAIFNYPKSIQTIPPSLKFTWNTQTTSGSPASIWSTGVNNNYDICWFSLPTSLSMDNMLNYCFFGSPGNDTIRYILENSQGSWDWSEATDFTTVSATLNSFIQYPKSLTNTPGTLANNTPFNYSIPNFSKMFVKDMITKVKFNESYLKHGSGIPLCYKVTDAGDLTIKLTINSSDSKYTDSKFSISKNDFLNPYSQVYGVVNGSAEKVLKEIQFSQAENEIKIQVDGGENLWLNIIPGNNANTNNSNCRFIKISKLEISLDKK